MNIYLTLDHELYFGPKHGTVESCMLKPGDELLKIGEETGARMTFFVDAGFLVKLNEYRAKYSTLDKDYKALERQLQRMTEQGHAVQLHIHPHWEDCHYDGQQWQIDVSRYKLADFEEKDIQEMMTRYRKQLEQMSGQPVLSYRAGGWCLQPFSKVKQAFLENNIQIDSTVYPNGHFESEHYYYDFRNVPAKKRWRFDDDLCVESVNGQFLEMPIASMKTGPLFFWQLFLWGRLDPKNHKPIGDGYPIPTPGWRKKVLTSSSNNCVSLDGYFATQLKRAVRHHEQLRQGDDLVVIGHPKACTWYSLKVLRKFILKHRDRHRFVTFNDIL